MTVHHFFLIAGAGACIYFQKYGAFAMLGLMMEVNSVFLHTRALIQYCNQRRTLAYKIMSIGNILTNIPFRLGVNYLIYSWYANGYPDFQFGKILYPLYINRKYISLLRLLWESDNIWTECEAAISNFSIWLRERHRFSL